MDGLFERICWIAAYCASLAGQRALQGATDNYVREQASIDARKAVEAMRGVK